jgi:tetratricopeptide (TPR) repeat protein
VSAASFDRVRALFDRVMALPPEARSAALSDPAIDPEVRAEASALLAHAPLPDDGIAGRVAAIAASVGTGLPARIGPYRIRGVLGEGGMGLVLEGLRDDGTYTQPVAIKRLRGFAGEAARARLLRERQLLAHLDHPHIARLLDGGNDTDGEPYLVMQRIEGRTLTRWANETRADLRARVLVLSKVCRAVQHAHRHLILHRDLKPDNIMVRDDGEPVLLDFGIARLFDTEEGTVTRAMTPAYASPEQLQGRAATTASDVFALGLVLHELLTGRLPRRQHGADGVPLELPLASRSLDADTAERAPVPAGALRGDLDRIVRRALRLAPAERYGSAEDLANDLDAWREGRPVRASELGWSYIIGKFVVRHRLAVGLATVALALAGVLALQVARQNATAQAARLAAERDAAAAEETGALLQSLFSEIDPKRFPGRQLGALDLLDLGRARLDGMVHMRGVLRAALTLRLSTLYSNAGRPDRHLELAQRARQLLDTDADDPLLRLRIDAEILRARVDLAQWREAEEQVAPTLAAARALGQHGIEGDVLLAQGRIATNVLDAPAAKASFDAATAAYVAAGAEGESGIDAVEYARANLAEGTGDFEDALERFALSYASRWARHGPDHPDTLRSQFGVAISLNFLGRTDAARAIYTDIAERTRRTAGERSESMAIVAAGMATADRRLGHYEAAERGYRYALSIHEEIGGAAGSGRAADQLANLARMREELGDLDAAELMNTQALALRLRRFGPDSREIALSWQNMADYRIGRADLVGARRALEQALRIRRHEFPEGHFLRVISEATMWIIDAREGRVPDDAPSPEAFESMLARTPFNTRLSLLEAMAAIAGVRGDHTGVVAAIERKLALLRQRHPAGHPVVAMAELRLAEALADSGERAAARAMITRAAATLQRTHVPTSPWLARALWLQQHRRVHTPGAR